MADIHHTSFVFHICVSHLVFQYVCSLCTVTTFYFLNKVTEKLSANVKADQATGKKQFESKVRLHTVKHCVASLRILCWL